MDFSIFLTHVAFALFLMLISWISTWWMVKVAILDIPNERSSHRKPTPRAGGISIVITFIVGICIIFLVADKAQIKQQYFFGFLFSAAVMALISFYDDIKSYSFKIKLLTHILAIIVLLFSGIVIDAMAVPFFGVVKLGLCGYFLTFLWVLGLSNAYNFMDGIDGLAASTAVIVCAFFGWITFHQGSHFIYIVCYTILSGAGGFWFWNRSPAKIFMGDVGSIFLGFVFACMAILADRYDLSHTSILVMPLLMLHFIFDTVFTMVRRQLAGEDITQAHRTHLYQLLVRMGLSHQEVAHWYGLLAILQGLAAVSMLELVGDMRLFIFVPFIFAYTLIAYKIISKARSLDII